jgi:hypothetical protein
MTNLLLRPGEPNEYVVIADDKVVGRISLFSSAGRYALDVVAISAMAASIRAASRRTCRRPPAKGGGHPHLPVTVAPTAAAREGEGAVINFPVFS